VELLAFYLPRKNRHEAHVLASIHARHAARSKDINRRKKNAKKLPKQNYIKTGVKLANRFGYPEVAVQARVQTQSDDDGMRVHARLVTTFREILGHNSTTGPGPAALAAFNATPGLGCSCYTIKAPTTEARDAQKRQHGLATPWRFWIHGKNP
jgi:hypothetical protein